MFIYVDSPVGLKGGFEPRMLNLDHVAWFRPSGVNNVCPTIAAVDGTVISIKQSMLEIDTMLRDIGAVK